MFKNIRKFDLKKYFFIFMIQKLTMHFVHSFYFLFWQQITFYLKCIQLFLVSNIIQGTDPKKHKISFMSVPRAPTHNVYNMGVGHILFIVTHMAILFFLGSCVFDMQFVCTFVRFIALLACLYNVFTSYSKLLLTAK